MEAIRETFAGELGTRWKPHVVGTGALEPTGSTMRLALSDASTEEYSNAQIDDYQGLPRRRFYWHPPLRLTVRARFSAPADGLQGTAGFGFWNDPFLMTTQPLPALPRALWFFFGSPTSNMKLDLETPGHGWKVAVIDALHPAALALAPLAPLAVPLMNMGPVYRALWPSIQRTLKVREASIPVAITQWNTYLLEWGIARSRFSIVENAGAEAIPILDAPSPKGPLGFVMWMDNQYLVATPWGELRWGLLNAPGRQWLEIAQIVIDPLAEPRLG